MKREIVCYKCQCSKCGHQWVTKTHDLPWTCSKCKSRLWNDDDEEGFENSLPTSTSSNSNPPPKGKLSIDELRALISPIEKKETKKEEVIQVVEESWKFTNDKPEYHENGRVYRKQILAPEFKKTRTVRVDEEDHTLVID